MSYSIDLSDEIVADDWIVPEKEITSKRLIGRTQRHNIYKADWFGDVLVYEPIAKNRNIQKTIKDEEAKMEEKSILDRNELSWRLNNLSLKLVSSKPLSRSQLSLNSDTDSAYSSNSSTPNNKNLEHQFDFKFPNSKLSSPTLSPSGSTNGSFTYELNDELNNKHEQTSCKLMVLSLGETKQVKEQEEAFVLNKESFTFGCSVQGTNSNNTKEITATRGKQSSWLELNELRLIAHESFMLFVGASLAQEEANLGNQQQHSLVIQMNHPKSVSLYNLLHASRLASTPLERFCFQQQQQQLGLGSKLNICQQVINAMTYLHDRNVVHGRLTSLNVYLELNQRVKISLIDNGEVGAVCEIKRVSESNKRCAEFNLPSLTYLSPELVRSISVNGNCDIQLDLNKLTKKVDTFAFGTLLFELFQERFPFGHSASKATSSPLLSSFSTYLQTEKPSRNWNGNIRTSASQLIYQIGSGEISENLEEIEERLPSKIEKLIRSCWSAQPELRPHFKQLSKSF